MLAGSIVVTTLIAAPPARSPGVVQLQAWLNQLDDENFALREQATEQLQAAGEQAIDALAEGALSSSPEVAWRAGEALKRIAVSGNERTINRVAEALERVGKQGRSGVVQVVSEIRARQKQLKHDRAAAQIRRLGGGLSGGMAGFGGEMMVEVGFLPVAMPAIVEVEEVLEVKERAVEVAAAEAAEAGAAAAEAAAVAAKAAAIAAEAAAKAAAVPAAKEPDERLPAAPPTEVKEVVERLVPAERPLEIIGGKKDPDEPAADESTNEPADELDAFRQLSRLPIDAEEAEAGGAEAGGAEAEAEIVAADLEGFAMPAEAIFIAGGGGGFIELDGEEGAQAESLMLDANWRGADAGLAALRDLPDVTSVSIQGAKLGDEALKHIAALPRLSSITIRGTVFSVAALRKLHEAHPKAYLFCQGEAMVGIHADTGGSCILTSVYPGSGAADAGLRPGDEIVAIDDVAIRDFSELTISVYGHKVGSKLKIEYERGGERHTVHVELKARSVLEP
jgi:hypothetical protein